MSCPYQHGSKPQTICDTVEKLTGIHVHSAWHGEPRTEEEKELGLPSRDDQIRVAETLKRWDENYNTEGSPSSPASKEEAARAFEDMAASFGESPYNTELEPLYNKILSGEIQLTRKQAARLATMNEITRRLQQAEEDRRLRDPILNNIREQENLAAQASELLKTAETDEQYTRSKKQYMEAERARRQLWKDYARKNNITTPDKVTDNLTFTAYAAHNNLEVRTSPGREISSYVLREYASALHETLEKLPWMREAKNPGTPDEWRFKGIDLRNIKDMPPVVQDFSDGAYAITRNESGLSGNTGGPVIYLTTNYPETGTGIMGEIGYTISHTPKEAFTHELGHAAAMAHPNASWQQLKAAAEYQQAIAWPGTKRHNSRQQAIRDVGGYAGENTDEFLAEVFSAISDPKVLAKIPTEAGRKRVIAFAKGMNTQLRQPLFPL